MSMTVEDGVPCQAKPVPDTPSNVLEQFSLKGKVAVVVGKLSENKQPSISEYTY